MQETLAKRSILSSRDSSKQIVQVTTKISNAGFNVCGSFGRTCISLFFGLKAHMPTKAQSGRCDGPAFVNGHNEEV